MKRTQLKRLTPLKASREHAERQPTTAQPMKRATAPVKRAIRVDPPSTAAGQTRRQRTPKPRAERLWPRVDRSAGPDGCWPFRGARTSKGYGHINIGRVDGKVSYQHAHRAAYELANDVIIPAGLVVMHSCDNPPCCNPAHLKLGTKADNSADMVLKGRSSRQQNERSGKARLTNAEVTEIRSRVAGGEPQWSVAASFGVHPAHVSRIVNLRRRPIEQVSA